MKEKLVVALDRSSRDEILALADRLSGSVGMLKIGLQAYVANGPELVRELVGRGERVFLDLKFHDIPNTVAQACAAATRLGVWMLNVHASGGRAMLCAAREAVDRTATATGRPRPHLIAVTVLTSLRASDLAETGVADPPETQVLRLATLARSQGIDGVVCSSREATALRAACGPQFLLVTPGIRPAGTDTHDQARVATPAEARAAGADFLVIGRPITQAPDPQAALESIQRTLGRNA